MGRANASTSASGNGNGNKPKKINNATTIADNSKKIKKLKYRRVKLRHAFAAKLQIWVNAKPDEDADNTFGTTFHSILNDVKGAILQLFREFLGLNRISARRGLNFDKEWAQLLTELENKHPGASVQAEFYAYKFYPSGHMCGKPETVIEYIGDEVQTWE